MLAALRRLEEPLVPAPTLHRIATACVASLLVSTAMAQTAPQKITGPQARYWLNAETASGFSMAGMQGGAAGGAGGLAGMMGQMMGGGGPRKSLKLDLGSTREGNPAEATHHIPAGMTMGASLPLLGPERGTPLPPEPVERDISEPPQGEMPKGRMLFFWGCGESAGAGQPVVLDIAKLAQGQLPPDMRNAAIANLRSFRTGPGAARDRGFADWPNRRNSTAVPARASLVGEHRVQGNFVPEIRFAVGAAHDWMEPLVLSTNKGGGGQKLQWNRVPTALGYFANGMGFKEGAGGANDMVFWNSSTPRLLGGETLLGFLPPAETDRLVKAGVVLKPESTDCAVPREALVAAGGELMMLNLNAFGPELNVVHPPRPEDPKVTWEQEYAVKLRLRSYTGLVAGMEGRPQRSAAAEPAPAGGEAPKPASATEQAKEAANRLLKGILGR
jgi:hypothetical protein